MRTKKTKTKSTGKGRVIETYYRVETVFRVRLEVEKASKSDGEMQRNFRLFFEKLAAAPELRKEFIKFAIYEFFIQDDSEMISELISIPETDYEYIFPAAQTCGPEVGEYFQRIFAPDAEPGQEGQDGQEDEETPEIEQVLSLLFKHLALTPVSAMIKELRLRKGKKGKDVSHSTHSTHNIGKERPESPRERVSVYPHQPATPPPVGSPPAKNAR